MQMLRLKQEMELKLEFELELRAKWMGSGQNEKPKLKTEREALNEAENAPQNDAAMKRVFCRMVRVSHCFALWLAFSGEPVIDMGMQMRWYIPEWPVSSWINTLVPIMMGTLGVQMADVLW